MSYLFNIGGIIENALSNFFENFLDQLITTFGSTMADITSLSLRVLELEFVKNGIRYAQILAFALLTAKTMNEAFQTYILYQNGDPDADPAGLLIRTAQAVAVIAVLPWIVTQIFTFGGKLASDVAALSTGKAGIEDWSYISAMTFGTGGIAILLFLIIVVIMLFVVAIQATIRGAELALTAVIGPVLALNITANNRSLWNAWFKQIIVICTSQALQIFMLKGALAMLTGSAISEPGLLFVFGWLWVTIKTPKFLQQFVYSSGFTSAVGGAARQVGTTYFIRKIMAK